LAVVYAVLVETGLTSTETGKIIMAACFVTDLGTVIALSVLFAQVNWWTLGFYLISLVVIIFASPVFRWFCRRYGGRVIEPDIKLIFMILFGIMLLGGSATATRCSRSSSWAQSSPRVSPGSAICSAS